MPVANLLLLIRFHVVRRTPTIGRALCHAVISLIPVNRMTAYYNTKLLYYNEYNMYDSLSDLGFGHTTVLRLLLLCIISVSCQSRNASVRGVGL